MTGHASHLSHLECTECRERHEADTLQTICRRCGHPLAARYDLEAARERLKPADLASGDANLWRFAALLPVRTPRNRITLGEGATPLLRVDGVEGLKEVWVKDEGLNPTGSFKARGLCVAVARAVELGAKNIAVPTAGNAGVAMAAYAARAGVKATVFAPDDVPPRILRSLHGYGATVTTVPGLISDAGRACADFVGSNPGTLDVSTLKEPYRAEGKKTMGLELAQHFAYDGPDVVVYPAGGGTGVVGIPKAYRELEVLGWKKGAAPRLVVVQAEGCAPIVRALRERKDTCEFWTGAATGAHGLRVPRPFADKWVLRSIRESRGGGVTVSEDELREGSKSLGRRGINAGPEGGAAWAGLAKARSEGLIDARERVVVFNTGSSLVY